MCTRHADDNYMGTNICAVARECMQPNMHARIICFDNHICRHYYRCVHKVFICELVRHCVFVFRYRLPHIQRSARLPNCCASNFVTYSVVWMERLANIRSYRVVDVNLIFFCIFDEMNHNKSKLAI